MVFSNPMRAQKGVFLGRGGGVDAFWAGFSGREEGFAPFSPDFQCAPRAGNVPQTLEPRRRVIAPFAIDLLPWSFRPAWELGLSLSASHEGPNGDL